MYVYIYRAVFKKRKVIRYFCEIATHFGKVIRNCDHNLQRVRIFALYA